VGGRLPTAGAACGDERLCQPALQVCEPVCIAVVVLFENQGGRPGATETNVRERGQPRPEVRPAALVDNILLGSSESAAMSTGTAVIGSSRLLTSEGCGFKVVSGGMEGGLSSPAKV